MFRPIILFQNEERCQGWSFEKQTLRDSLTDLFLFLFLLSFTEPWLSSFNHTKIKTYFLLWNCTTKRLILCFITVLNLLQEKQDTQKTRKKKGHVQLLEIPLSENINFIPAECFLCVTGEALGLALIYFAFPNLRSS